MSTKSLVWNKVTVADKQRCEGLLIETLKVTGRETESQRERRKKWEQCSSLDSPGSACVAHSLSSSVCTYVNVWVRSFQGFFPWRRILQSHPVLFSSTLSPVLIPSPYSYCLPLLVLSVTPCPATCLFCHRGTSCYVFLTLFIPPGRFSKPLPRSGARHFQTTASILAKRDPINLTSLHPVWILLPFKPVHSCLPSLYHPFTYLIFLSSQ